MVSKIVLRDPINVVYEGILFNVVVKVFEIRILRSGKPYKVYGKNLNHPQKQAAPYDYEYLDFESKEKIDKIVKRNERYL